MNIDFSVRWMTILNEAEILAKIMGLEDILNNILLFNTYLIISSNINKIDIFLNIFCFKVINSVFLHQINHK